MATTKKDGRTGLKGGPAAEVLAIPKPAPKVLNEQLHSDIALLAKASAKLIVREENSVEIPADRVDRAVDLLGLTRALVRNTESDYKARITPIEDPFAKYASEKKAITKQAQEIEHDLEVGLQGLVSQGLLGQAGYESKSGCRLSLVAKRELVMDDPDAVSDEFLLPRAQCLDWGKIKAAIEATEKAIEAAAAAGITLDLKNPLTGCHLTTTYTFRTKLPDELGN